MILRKPYAFIIKHFRLIHLLILGCLLFVTYNYSGISSLVNSLIDTRTYVYAGTDVYIDNLMYFFIILALFLSGVVYWLLKEKKKPVGLYLWCILYNIVNLVAVYYLFKVLTKLQTEQLSIDTLSFMKDILLLLRLPAYVLMGVCFIRGIGFNLKQFNFSKDVAELKIAEEDSAEFEIMVGQNNYKYERFIRRTIRELKYYIQENTVAITIMFIVIGGLLTILGIRYYNQYLKKLKEQEVTTVNGISYVINSTYVTAEDYNGNLIKDGSKFVVVDMSFNNTTDKDKALDLELITLATGKLYYHPTQSYNSKFYDLGVPYERDTKIPSDEMLDGYLVFEIPDTVDTTKFTLRIQYGIEKKRKKIKANYRKLEANARVIDTENRTYHRNLKDDINPNVNNENQFNFRINDFNIQETFSNKYVLCDRSLLCKAFNNVISANNFNNQTMLVLSFDATMYEDAKFTKTFNSYNKVFANYTYLEYEAKSNRYSEKISLVPHSDVEDKAFLIVDRRIKDANKIKLVFKFRNYNYVIDLKS